MITRRFLFRVAVATLWPVVLSNPAEAQVSPVPTSESRIDPPADRILRQMSDFYKGLNSASVEITTEFQGEWGQHGPSLISKIMTISVAVQRPNGYASRLTKGKRPLQWLVTDGAKTACDAGPFGGYWVEDRPLEQCANRVPGWQQPRNGVAALGEWLLIDKDLYDSVMNSVRKCHYVGLEKTDEGEHHHLKFSQENAPWLPGDVTWDLWVQSGPQPLVHKVVMVPSEKRLKYTEPPIIFEILEKVTTTFSNWKVNPDLPKETFVIPPRPKSQ